MAFIDKDLVSLKLEDYGLEYINVKVKSSIDLNSSDAYICVCPSSMDFDTNRNAYDCAVIRKEITEQTESFTLDLTEVKKGEYYIVVVSDLKNEDGKSYVFNLFALR
ncbi:MAG: hypothetical protein MJ246_04285 [Clostridia bacterium]|nr:hypothetical protein [Clostridia bacterium]